MKTSIYEVGMNEFSQCTMIAISAWQRGYEEYEDILGKDLFSDIFSDWQKVKADSMEPFFKESKEKNAYIILCDGETAGFITCKMDKIKKIGTICNNAVTPEFQGKGLGSLMYDFILDLFKKEGMTVAAVNTMNGTAYLPARKAYEKAGFNKKLEKFTYYMKL